MATDRDPLVPICGVSWHVRGGLRVIMTRIITRIRYFYELKGKDLIGQRRCMRKHFRSAATRRRQHRLTFLWGMRKPLPRSIRQPKRPSMSEGIATHMLIIILKRDPRFGGISRPGSQKKNRPWTHLRGRLKLFSGLYVYFALNSIQPSMFITIYFMNRRLQTFTPSV